MIRQVLLRRSVEAAIVDARLAVIEFDEARRGLADAVMRPMEPLAAEVWVFDEHLAQVLLVNHRWRGWVPPGGKVEPGETPREAARRRLLEETGLRLDLLGAPAAVTVRSYRPGWPATLGLSYAAVIDAPSPRQAEHGQPVAWKRLDRGWDSCFAEGRPRMRRHAEWITRESSDRG